MVGAVEFLRKAKAIYENCEMKCSDGSECPMESLCDDSGKYKVETIIESDLVAKVMAYKIKEGNNG